MLLKDLLDLLGFFPLNPNNIEGQLHSRQSTVRSQHRSRKHTPRKMYAPVMVLEIPVKDAHSHQERLDSRKPMRSLKNPRQKRTKTSQIARMTMSDMDLIPPKIRDRRKVRDGRSNAV